MKKIILFSALASLLIFGNPYSIYSQNVGVSANASIPDASALLDVDAAGSTPKKGLLIPRISLTSATDKLTIPGPATSLLVYNVGTSGLSPAGYYYNQGTTGSANWVAFLTNEANPNEINGRLTLTSGTAVTTSDVTAATTVYFTPYKGARIALYGGEQWYIKKFTELSVSVPATTDKNFDVFIYDNAGTLTLETVNWTDNTNRATALVLQDGIYVKSGATTRRYLGTCRTTGVSGKTEDSQLKRFVWNNYNRIQKSLLVKDLTGWTYTTATWRQANANTANKVEFVFGLAENELEVNVHCFAHSNDASGLYMSTGIGISSITVNSAQTFGSYNWSSDLGKPANSHYRGFPGSGYFYAAWLEVSYARGTTSWYGALTDGINWIEAGLDASAEF